MGDTQQDDLITVSSSDWEIINVRAISNCDGEIVVGERTKDAAEKFYTRHLWCQVPRSEWEKLYATMKHIEGDCGGVEECEYCREQYGDGEEDGG